MNCRKRPTALLPRHCLLKAKSIFLLSVIFSVAYLVPISHAAPPSVPTPPELLPRSSLDSESELSPDLYDEDLYNDVELLYSDRLESHQHAPRDELSPFDYLVVGEDKRDGIFVLEPPPSYRQSIFVNYDTNSELEDKGNDGIAYKGEIFTARQSRNILSSEKWKKSGKATPVAVRVEAVYSDWRFLSMMQVPSQDNPFLQTLIAYFKYQEPHGDKEKPVFVFPLYNGTLEGVVRDSGKDLRKDMIFFFSHLLKGLEAIHQQRFRYGNVAPSNVLVNTHVKDNAVGITKVVWTDFTKTKPEAEILPSLKDDDEQASPYEDCYHLALAILRLTSDDPKNAKEQQYLDDELHGDMCNRDVLTQTVNNYYPHQDQGQVFRSEQLHNVLLRVIGGEIIPSFFKGDRITSAEQFLEEYISTTDYKDAREMVCKRNRDWGQTTVDCDGK